MGSLGEDPKEICMQTVTVMTTQRAACACRTCSTQLQGGPAPVGHTGAHKGDADSMDVLSSAATTDLAGRGGKPAATTTLRALLLDSYGQPSCPGQPPITATASVMRLSGLSSAQRVSKSPRSLEMQSRYTELVRHCLTVSLISLKPAVSASPLRRAEPQSHAPLSRGRD